MIPVKYKKRLFLIIDTNGTIAKTQKSSAKYITIMVLLLHSVLICRVWKIVNAQTNKTQEIADILKKTLLLNGMSLP